MTDPRTVTTVLFDGFEPLDVFGPLELFGSLPDQFRLVLAGPGGPVASAHGYRVLTDFSYETVPSGGIVLVPGGRGTRPLVTDAAFLRWLATWAAGAELVTSVCTGSALLAAAGLLDGYRATSNKRAFAWARAQGPRVDWVPRARWVEDRDRWTSSGVAAGMDMALALIGRLHGRDMALEIASRVELEWHEDDEWDPFAAEAGLVEG
jgi:transcriptional regulator GlxA family with amidase domain